MNLSAPFIERPVMTTLLMLTLLFLGVMAYYHLPVASLPDVDYPTINVKATLPGGSPETMANTVATPLEKQFLTIPGVTNVTSTNTLGNTNIVVEFEVTKNIDSAAQDVQAAITAAKSNLPPDLPQDPTYKKVNPSATPILYIALTSSTLPLKDLYTIANIVIGQQISTIEGVAQVQTYGSPYAVRVQVDSGKLAAKSITLSDVSTAISAGNQTKPTGQLDGDNQAAIIRVNGQLISATEYNPLIIRYVKDAPVRIQDVGKAIDSLQNDRQTTLYVDKNCIQPTVVLAIQRQPGANTVQVADGINQFLSTRLQKLPASVAMQIVFDRSQPIRESVAEVKLTLILAFILVVFVIFLYLGSLRDTIIPSIVLPLSVIGTFVFMYYYGFTIDNLSLLALTLAIGFIIDDAIVVLENIVRRIENGEVPFQAAMEGSKQISFTILSMTLSLIAVFIPLLFLGGLIGKIFQEFSITLCIITLLSGVISLTLTPMLCSRFLPPRGQEQRESWMGRLSKKLNDNMLGWYAPKLKWMLSHRWIPLTIGIVSLVLTIFFFKILPTDFIADDDIGFIIAFTEGAEGTSSEKMAYYQTQFLKLVQKEPYVASVISITANASYRQGLNFIRLVPIDQRSSSTQIIQELSQKVKAIPGLNAFFKNVPLIDLSIGSANKGPYQYTLQGLDPDALYSSSEKLLEKIKADPMFLSATSDMEQKTPQLYIEVLRDQASRLGIDVEQIEDSLLLAYSGNRVSRIQTPVDQYDVILELNRDEQRKAASLDKLYVRNKNTSELVPLNTVAKWKEGVGPNSINHISQFPAVTITFAVRPDVPLGTALERFKHYAEEILPVNVKGSVKGAAETFEQAIQSATFLLIFAVLAIYLVLGILYESFIHPLTILSTLPPAALGALITLFALGRPLSLYAFLGIVLLIGIVKKNGIMMVDYALDNLRTKGRTPEQAIYEACLVRFRPIMMTTMAAVFGALPIALGWGAGADARRPLGIVIIGGLLFSQLITLFLTPVVYLYLERFSQKIQTNGTNNDNKDRGP